MGRFPRRPGRTLPRPRLSSLRTTFAVTFAVVTAAGSGRFIERTVEQTVPIAIFESDEKTEVADIPVNAN